MRSVISVRSRDEGCPPTDCMRLNDVSLTSCSLGALATGVEFPIRFRGRLAFMEDALTVRVASVANALNEHDRWRGADFDWVI